MTILLPTLAVSFAAFCIWLTVRIINRREKWAKWMLAAVVGLPVLYVLSSGPTRPLLIRHHVTGGGIRGTGGEILIREEYDYWRPLFGPLEDFWAEHYGDAWAAPLDWYWDFFPAGDHVPRDEQRDE